LRLWSDCESIGGNAPRASSRAAFAICISATCWRNPRREALASAGAWPRGVAPQRGPSLLSAKSNGSLCTCGKSGPQRGVVPERGTLRPTRFVEGSLCIYGKSAAERAVLTTSSSRRSTRVLAVRCDPEAASCRIATSRECSSNLHPPHLSLRHPSYRLPRRQFCLHVPFMLVFSPLRQAGQSFKGLPRGCPTTVQPSGEPHPMWIGAKVGLFLLFFTRSQAGCWQREAEGRLPRPPAGSSAAPALWSSTRRMEDCIDQSILELERHSSS